MRIGITRPMVRAADMPVQSLPKSGFSEFQSYAAEFDCHRIFWACAILHVALWTIIPAWTNPNALVDVIEGYAWGHEWLLGTYKHPPLAAWILEIFAIVTGRAFWAHFLASQLAILVAFWAVWQTGHRIAGEMNALIGALMLAGIAYYNVIIPEFNPNVLQIPLWALMGYSFHRAVKGNRITDWILLGVWSAGGLYTKYSSLLMLATLGILMLTHVESRKRMKSPGPYVATATAFVLFLPHIIWLFNNHFLPFIYAESRFETVTAGFVVAPALLTVWQIAACLPAILIFGIAFWRRVNLCKQAHSFDAVFLSFVAFGPFVIAFLIAAAKGAVIRNMWGAPFWNFLGLWAVFYFRPNLSPATLRRFACSWGAALIAGLTIVATNNLFAPYFTHKASPIYFPGRALAERIESEWRERYHTPLRYVLGDIWVAGNVAYYAPDRPHVFIDLDYAINPKIVPEDIGRSGGVIVWCRGSCTAENVSIMKPKLWTDFVTRPEGQGTEEQPVLTFPQQTDAPVPPVNIGWAFIPPKEGVRP